MPDFLTLSMCFYRVCERRNLPLKAQKSQIWDGGNAGVKLNFSFDDRFEKREKSIQMPLIFADNGRR